MNARIQEHAKQAVQYALDKSNEGDDEDYEYSFDDDFQEKFAELIVKECMSYMEDGDIDFAKFMIKKNFGITE
jgi:Fe-S cluster assembly iron-binding protein IscA